MSQGPSTRVRGINALLTVVDFAAGAIGAAEGELAQKDAVIRQLTEQLAAREWEKAAAEERARQEFELVERLKAGTAELQALLERERAAVSPWESRVRELIVGLFYERDRLIPHENVDSLIGRLDAKIDALRSHL